MSCGCAGPAWWDPTLLPVDLCADLRHHPCDCDRKKVDDRFDDDRLVRRRFPKLLPAIPITRLTVDCTPVSFRTPGQAVNVVSCPVSQVVTTPVTRPVDLQVPLGFGCVLTVPLTQTVAVPTVTTVNVPPLQTPVPTVVCPPGVLG